MEIKELHKQDLDFVIESYIKHRHEFIDLCTLEDFAEQYCHRCDNCGHIICLIDYEICPECRNREDIDRDFEIFDREKEHYVYNIY